MEDSLSAKLGNVLESDNDINTSEDAIKKLNESKKVFKKDKGKGGLIDENKDKLFELQRKFENSKADIEALDARKKQLNIKIEELKQLEEKRENARIFFKKCLFNFSLFPFSRFYFFRFCFSRLFRFFLCRLSF